MKKGFIGFLVMFFLIFVFSVQGFALTDINGDLAENSFSAVNLETGESTLWTSNVVDMEVQKTDFDGSYTPHDVYGIRLNNLYSCPSLCKPSDPGCKPEQREHCRYLNFEMGNMESGINKISVKVKAGQCENPNIKVLGEVILQNSKTWEVLAGPVKFTVGPEQFITIELAVTQIPKNTPVQINISPLASLNNGQDEEGNGEWPWDFVVDTAQIEWKNTGGGGDNGDSDTGDGSTTDTDGDGVLDNIDQCPNTPTGVYADELGCSVNDECNDEFNLEISIKKGSKKINIIDSNGKFLVNSAKVYKKYPHSTKIPSGACQRGCYLEIRSGNPNQWEYSIFTPAEKQVGLQLERNSTPNNSNTNGGGGIIRYRFNACGTLSDIQY